MSSINKVMLIGRLGADPEVRYTSAGEPVANLRVATNELSRNRSTGERTEHTEWHRVVAYRHLAEIARDHIRKGALIYIEGRIRNRKSQDSNGASRHTTEIEAQGFRLLDKRAVSLAGDEEAQPQVPPETPRGAERVNPGNPWDVTDVPF